jgi:hypothetical protein
MNDKIFKPGVYLKPNGDLVAIFTELSDDGVYWKVMDGRKCTNKVLNSFYKMQGLPRPYMEWTSNSPRLGWGGTEFLLKCEYLGEL